MLTHLASPNNHLRATTQSDQSYLNQFVTNKKNQDYHSSNFHNKPKESKSGSHHRNEMVSYSPSMVSQDKFKEIEEILNRQNSNLKHHRDFLLSEVRRYNDTLNKYKTKMKDYKRKIQQLQHEKDVYKMQCLQMKDYVFKGISRMESIVQTKESSTQQHIDKYPLNRQFYQHSFRPTLQPQRTQPNVTISQETQEQSTTHYLEDLNDKFEALMYQYRTTKSHQSRRKCIQLAKQIKNIKFKLNQSEEVLKQHSLGNSSVGGRMSQHKNNATTLKFINNTNPLIIPVSPNSLQNKYKMPPKLVKYNLDQQQSHTSTNLIEAYCLRKASNTIGDEIKKNHKEENFGKYIKDKMNK